MQISFFEEFPTKENLKKINLITWPTKLYIAAKRLQEFNRIKSSIKNKNIKEFIYWPILEINEGYWISPFTQRSALNRIVDELKDVNISVMLDLELPTTKNLKLYFTQLLNFARDKLLIKRFIKKYKGNIYLAEYYLEGRRKERMLQFLGLHYRNKKARIIKMIYHSLHHFDNDFIASELKTGKKKWGDNFLVAYGTIARGIGGWEPKLHLSQLKEDLKIAQEAEIKEVIIYRLGGLNKKYVDVLKRFR